MDLICNEHNRKIKYFCLNQQQDETKCQSSRTFLCILCVKNHDKSCIQQHLYEIEYAKKISFETCAQNCENVYVQQLSNLKCEIEKELDDSFNMVYENVLENAYQIDYNIEDLQNIEKIKDIKKYYKQMLFKDTIILESKLRQTMQNLELKLRSFKEIFESDLYQVTENLNNDFILNTKFLGLIDFQSSQKISIEKIAERKFCVQNLPTNTKEFNSFTIQIGNENLFFKLTIKKKTGFEPLQKILKFNIKDQTKYPLNEAQVQNLKNQLVEFSNNLNLCNKEDSLQYYFNFKTWPVGEVSIYDQDYNEILKSNFFVKGLDFLVGIKGNLIYLEISQEQII